MCSIQAQSHHRSPKLFEIRLLNLAMSNRLSVVRTLRNSENVRASMGENVPGGGGYSRILPIRVCAAQRGLDFEAPDLERGIHFRGVF